MPSMRAEEAEPLVRSLRSRKLVGSLPEEREPEVQFDHQLEANISSKRAVNNQVEEEAQVVNSESISLFIHNSF